MSSRRHVLATSALLAAALSPLLTLACDERRAPSEPRRDAPAHAASVAGADAVARERLGGPGPGGGPEALIAGALAGRLPSTDTVTSGVPAFEIRQRGSGIAGRFEITNPNSAAIALDGVSAGTGHALLAWNLGRGRGAVVITSNSTNTLPALDVSSQSLGTATLAAAADIRANNANATAPAVKVSTLGQNTALLVDHKSTGSSSLNVLVLQSNGINRARVDRNGKGFFDGGVQAGGADVAEAFAVEGAVGHYEPGDVLVISTRSDRRLERSGRAYSTRVVGVHATKPGLVLSERGGDAGLDGTVPLGVVGVIPTKVSAENGAIRRGDLLVTARTRGHAMRGTDRGRMLGAVVGKALAEFAGPGTAVIPVFVNVR
jgi:trimeric autotransporter adhesin